MLYLKVSDIAINNVLTTNCRECLLGWSHKNSLTWAVLVSIEIKRKQQLQTFP